MRIGAGVLQECSIAFRRRRHHDLVIDVKLMYSAGRARSVLQVLSFCSLLLMLMMMMIREIVHRVEYRLFRPQ